MDYEQIPFNCRFCHSYGQFARNCKKKGDEEKVNEKNEQLTLVQKTGNPKLGTRKKNQEVVANEKLPSPVGTVTHISPFNQFAILISSELEEGEVHAFDGIKKDSKVTLNQAGPSLLNSLQDGDPLPIGE